RSPPRRVGPDDRRDRRQHPPGRRDDAGRRLMHASTLARVADLYVEVGANVQPGQIVSLETEVGKEAFTRAVAESAYRHGAKFVDVQIFDPWIKRTRIEHAEEDTLGFVPDWYGQRILELGRQRAARI